jgi:hypothetical protein
MEKKVTVPDWDSWSEVTFAAGTFEKSDRGQKALELLNNDLPTVIKLMAGKQIVDGQNFMDLHDRLCAIEKSLASIKSHFGIDG